MATSMKASELRIGNHINSGKSGNGIVKAIFGHDVILIDSITGEEWQPELENCNSIPLTEEWLVKFGFKGQQVYESVSDYWIPDGYQTKGHKVQTDGETFVFMGYKDGTEIEYVHQLQNLYFALTGEELTIK